jgi:hypothetical protein
MAILFAISVAAFFALIWASVSIARHIRRARRRRWRASAVTQSATWGGSESTSPLTDAPALAVKAEQISAPPPPPIPTQTAASESLAIRFPLSSQRRSAESSAAQAVATPSLTPPAEPVGASQALPSETGPASPPGATSAVRRPPVSVAAPTNSGSRTDWAYFNKDMGDLTDPVPSPRFKDRTRAH